MNKHIPSNPGSPRPSPEQTAAILATLAGLGAAPPAPPDYYGDALAQYRRAHHPAPEVAAACMAMICEAVEDAARGAIAGPGPRLP